MSEEPAIRGTPRYAAPEYMLGKMVDGRADIYSLGVILRELLGKGVPPVESIEEARNFYKNDSLAPLPVDDPYSWINLLTEYDPDQRIPNAEELTTLLSSKLADLK